MDPVEEERLEYERKWKRYGERVKRYRLCLRLDAGMFVPAREIIEGMRGSIAENRETYRLNGTWELTDSYTIGVLQRATEAENFLTTNHLALMALIEKEAAR